MERLWKEDQPIRLPGLKPGGMLRVDTERRFLPPFKNRDLAPSNVSRDRIPRVSNGPNPGHDNLRTG